jgi:hypothetical protein
MLNKRLKMAGKIQPFNILLLNLFIYIRFCLAQAITKNL